MGKISSYSFNSSPISSDYLLGNTASGPTTQKFKLADLIYPLSNAVQHAYNETGAVATGTTTIPFDDTIPQNTEGTQFMSQTITPKSATNILVIEVVAWLNNSTATHVSGALFQDSTANALAAVGTYDASAGGDIILILRHIMVAGTTSATTFKFRAGPSTAATVTFNGVAGGRVFGGVAASSMRIMEYKP